LLVTYGKLFGLKSSAALPWFRVALPAPDVFDSLVPIAFVPVPVEVAGRNGSELDEEVARQVLRFDLAALFPPKAQSALVIAHDTRASEPPMK
jgi:hypothetical protein